MNYVIHANQELEADKYKVENYKVENLTFLMWLYRSVFAVPLGEQKLQYDVMIFMYLSQDDRHSNYSC